MIKTNFSKRWAINLANDEGSVVGPTGHMLSVRKFSVTSLYIGGVWNYKLVYFKRKSQSIVIARLLLLLLAAAYKHFNVAHYSKSIKGIITKLGILAHHDKVQLQGKWHNSENYISGGMPLLT